MLSLERAPGSDPGTTPTLFASMLPRFMVLGAAAIWGSTYTISKFALEAITPQSLLAIRTLTGAAILAFVCRHRLASRISRRVLSMAAMVAVLYYFGFLLQMRGLALISPGRSAFLSALYCVIIPFIQWILRRRAPGIHHLLAAFLCLGGVWLVSTDSGGPGPESTLGDMLTIISAVAFAFYFYALGSLSLREDPLVLTFLIFLISGALFLAGALVTEPLPTHLATHPQALACVVYLVIAAIGAQILQNIGLARTSTMEASILLSTDTLFALGFSMVLFGERPGLISFSGFASIFAAVAIAVLGGRGNRRCDS